MLADYHLHSEFSDDSRTPMEKQIEAAIKKGIGEICFTEHVDYGIKKDWDEDDLPIEYGDGISIPVDEFEIAANCNYPEYFLKLDRMRKTYRDKITIKNGLEFGIQMHTVDKYKNILKKYGDLLDFILISFHQINDLELWNGQHMKNKTQDQYNKEYYEEMLRIVKSFKDYDVLAHCDLIARYDPNGNYPFEKIKDILTDIFKVVIADGKGIEINTSSWHYKLKDTMPARDVLKLYYDLGGRIITIGSDGHNPEYVGDHFEDAINVLKEIGFNQFYTYDKHQAIGHNFK